MSGRPARTVVLAAVLPAGLLVVGPGGLAPFGPAKWWAVSTLAAAGVALAAGRPGPPVARRPAVAWAVFLALVAVAAVAGVDRLYAWTGTPERNLGVLTWALCGLCFLASQGLGDEGDARLVAGAAVVAGAAYGAWSAAEALGWRPLAVEGSPGRVLGPLGSAAFTGAAAALLLPLAAGVALDPDWARRARVFAAGAGALLAVALVGSGARAAWVGTAAALATVGWLRRAWVRTHLRRVAGGAAVAVVALVALGAATGVGGRAGDLFHREGAGGASRLDEWRVAVRVVARHPLVGVGPEGYRIAFAEGVDAAYERAHGRAVLPDRAHDVLLDVAVTAGVPGMAAYGALMALVGAPLLRAVRRGPPWLAGLATGLVAYGVGELFLFPVGVVEPGVWLVAGLVVASVARPEEQVALPVPPGARAVAGGLAAVALVAGGLDVAADRQARNALASLAGGHISAAEREAERAVALRPDQLRYRLAAARAHAASGTDEGMAAALADLRSALRVSPRDPVVTAQRATLLLDRATATGRPADVAAARAALVRLVTGDLHNAELQLRLGVADALGGDDAGAERAWLVAEDLAPASAAAPTDLATAYARQGRWADARAAAERALRRRPGEPRAQEVVDEATRHGT
ncbi:MAG: O-antigen ligase family protein [Acidimicrobiales bacterium]